MTRCAPRFDDVEAAGAAAGAAPLLACDGDRPLAAAHRGVETQCEGLMQISAALGRRVLMARGAMTKDVGEEVAKCRSVGAVDADREIEPLEPERRRADRRRDRARRVVA